MTACTSGLMVQGTTGAVPERSNAATLDVAKAVARAVVKDAVMAVCVITATGAANTAAATVPANGEPVAAVSEART